MTGPIVMGFGKLNPVVDPPPPVAEPVEMPMAAPVFQPHVEMGPQPDPKT